MKKIVYYKPYLFWVWILSLAFVIQFIIAGIGAGLCAGMFGIGGGIVILPTLVLLLNWSFHSATGTSLATLMLPTGLMALNNYRKNNLLYIKGSAVLASGMILGSACGAILSLFVIKDGAIVKSLFGLYMVFVGIKYTNILHILKTWLIEKTDTIDTNSDASEYEFADPSSIKLLNFVIIGIVAGIFAGLFGIGGGLVITVIFVEIFKINPKQAVAISLAAMFLPVGFIGVSLYYSEQNVNIPVALILAVGIEIGAAISSRIAIKINQKTFKQWFGLLLIIVGIYFTLEKLIYGV